MTLLQKYYWVYKYGTKMFSEDPAITELINITESTSIKQKCLVKTRQLQNIFTLLSLSHYTQKLLMIS